MAGPLSQIYREGQGGGQGEGGAGMATQVHGPDYIHKPASAWADALTERMGDPNLRPEDHASFRKIRDAFREAHEAGYVASELKSLLESGRLVGDDKQDALDALSELKNRLNQLMSQFDVQKGVERHGMPGIGFEE